MKQSGGRFTQSIRLRGIVISPVFCKLWLKPNNPKGKEETDKELEAAFIKYREAVNNGELPYLIRSLVFMLLCVIHWCIGEMEKKGIISE